MTANDIPVFKPKVDMDAQVKAYQAREEMAACAHCNIELKQIKHDNGMFSDSWECRDCHLNFVPITSYHRLESENAELQKKLVEAENLSKCVKKFTSLSDFRKTGTFTYNEHMEYRAELYRAMCDALSKFLALYL